MGQARFAELGGAGAAPRERVVIRLGEHLGAGAEVAHTFVIFYYDIFKDTPEKLAAEGISLHYLATWWDVLAACKETDRFDAKTLAAVEAFLNDPRAWSKAHGGV